MSAQHYKILEESSFVFVNEQSREVLRITNDARLIIGEGFTKDEATQEVAKMLVAAFDEQIQKMVNKRVSDLKSELEKIVLIAGLKADSNVELRMRAEKAEADTKRLDWIASRKSTELVYFAAAGWSIIKSNGGDLLCDQNIHNFRDAIDAAMKETNK